MRGFAAAADRRLGFRPPKFSMNVSSFCTMNDQAGRLSRSSTSLLRKNSTSFNRPGLSGAMLSSTNWAAWFSPPLGEANEPYLRHS